jgi:GNAT superfamily N-acetyltransferase
MKFSFKLVVLAIALLASNLNAACKWDVLLKDGSHATLSICQDNLDAEKAVFNKAFTDAYSGTPIEPMILKKHPTLNAFLAAAFEDEEADFKAQKRDALFVNAKDANGNVLGCVAFDKKENNTVYVRQLAVAPEFKGKGLGSLLMYTFLKVWPETYHVGLLTRKLNNMARAFYIALGYTECSATEICTKLDPTVYTGYQRSLSRDFIRQTIKNYATSR